MQDVIDALHAQLREVDAGLIGRSLGRLVRGEPLEEAATAHRGALLRLAFLQHVWAPALEPGSLVLGAMRAQLMEADALPLDEVFEDLLSVLEVVGDPVKALVVDSLGRGFVAERAAAAMRGPELLQLDDAKVEELLAQGLPGPKR